MRWLWWAYGFLHSKDHIDMSRAQLSAIRSDHTTQPLKCSPILVCPCFVCKSIMESIKMSSAFDSNESSLKFQCISSDDKLQHWFHLVVLFSVGTHVCVCVDWINSLVIVLILMWSSTGHATNKSFYAKIIVWRIRNWTLMASRNVSLSSNYKNINLNQGMNRKNELVEWNSCRLCLEKYTIYLVWFERKNWFDSWLTIEKGFFKKLVPNLTCFRIPAEMHTKHFIASQWFILQVCIWKCLSKKFVYYHRMSFIFMFILLNGESNFRNVMQTDY